MVELPADWNEFVALLISHGVEFVVIGGHAVGYHGYPRYTGDIDFLVRTTDRNAAAIAAAVEEFGFTGSGQRLRTVLTQAGKVVQFGLPPNRIDLLTSIAGVGWEQVAEHSLDVDLGCHRVRIIGLEELLANKRASGRPKDLADVEELERVSNVSRAREP
jgi:predicted nucleotidyltransferase